MKNQDIRRILFSLKSFKKNLQKTKRAAKGAKTRFLKKLKTGRKKNTAPAKQKDKDQELQKIRKKNRLYKRVMKWFFYSIAAGMISMACIFIFITTYFSKETTTNLVKKVVEKQTGGNFDFNWSRYSFATGFEINDLKLYLPTTDKPYYKGGTTHKRATVHIPKISIDYDFSSIFLFRASISEAKISNPQIFISKSPKGLSIDGMLKYREKEFPKEETVNESKQGAVVPGWLPLVISSLYSPIRFSAENLGFSDLYTEVQIEDEKGERNTLSISGVSLVNSVEASGFNNKYKLKIFSEKDGMVVSQNNTPLIRTLPNLDFSISNLKSVRLNFSNLTRFPMVEGEPKLNIYSEIEAVFKDDYLGLDLKKSNFNLEDFFKLKANGIAAWPRNSLNDIDLKFENEFKFRTSDKFSSILKKFLDANVSGRIDEKCIVEGSLKILPDEMKLPVVDCSLVVSEFQASIGKLAKIFDLRGEAKVLVRNGHENQTFLVEPEFDFFIKNISGQLSGIAAEISSLSASLTSKVKISPKDISPRSYFDFALDDISLYKGDERDLIVSSPVEIGVQTRGLREQYSYEVESKVRVGEFFDNQSQIDCIKKCKKIRLKSFGDARNFSRVLDAGKRFVSKDLWAVLPSVFEGEASYELRTELNLPSDFNVNPYIIFKEASPSVSLKLEPKLSRIILLSQGLEVSNLNTAVKVSLQKDDLGIEIENLIKEIRINRNDIEAVSSNIENNLNLGLVIPIDFDYKETKAAISYKGLVSRTTASKYGSELFNVDKISTGLNLRARGVNHLELKEMSLALDEVLNTKASGDIELKKDFRPQNVELSAESEISLKALPKFLHNSDASGSFKNRTELSLKDEDSFSFNSSQQFNDIYMKVDLPGPNKNIFIEGLKGEFPVRYRGSLKKALAYINQKNNPKNESVEQAVKESLKERNEIEKSSSDTLRNLSSASAASLINKNPITFTRAGAAGFEVENVSVSSSLDLGGLFIDRAEFQTMGGTGSASLFIAMAPLPTRVIGTLHLAKVNTEEIPYRLSGKSIPGDIDKSLFSMNSHLDYSLAYSTMNGDISVTQIGKEQASYFLDLIDPSKEDKNINMARMGLNLGYPNGMTIPIRNGLMDVELDIRSLGIPLPLPNVSGFPVIGLIENLKTEKGF